MYMYIIEYANMIILLSNYPSILTWRQSHYLYLLGTWIYTMAYTYYEYNIQAFLLEGNVKKQYANVLRSHVIRTISTSLHSNLSVISIYLLQKEQAPYLILMSLYIHFVANYLYYFKPDHEYIALIKNTPHMIDTIIIIGCIHREMHLQLALGLICIARILSDVYISHKFISQMLLWVETYYVGKSFNVCIYEYNIC